MSLSSTELLISTQTCQQQLSEDDPTSPRILPVFVGSAEVFNQIHIPGSVHVSPAQLVCGIAPASGKLPDLDDLSLLFSDIGLKPEHSVVAYDDEGGGWAGRLLWTLELIGHKQYHLLDGGIVAWHADGLATESGHANPKPNVLESSYTLDNSQRVNAEDIIKMLGSENFAIWDARSEQEFSGEKILAAKGGHIPGAVNLDWLELMDRSQHLRLKPLDDIKRMLNERGITPEKKVITHCQSHHRSGLTWVVGKIIGLNIFAYDGSWSEWGNLDNTPVE